MTSFADLIKAVVLTPNDIEWSDLDGIEMHEKNYVKPSYETMEYLHKFNFTDMETNHYIRNKSVPECLSTLIIWSQNFVFYTVESGPPGPYNNEFDFIKILRNPTFDY